MKKYITIFAILALILPLGLVWAEDNDSKVRSRELLKEPEKILRETVREKVDKVQEEVRDGLRETKNEVRDEIESRREKLADQDNRRHNLLVNIKNKFSRMILRSQAAVTRLDNILARLTTRTETLEADGHEVSEIFELIREAGANLDLVRADLREIKATIENLDNLENQKEVLAGLKGKIRLVAQNLRALRSDLREILNQIKAVVGDDNSDADRDDN